MDRWYVVNSHVHAESRAAHHLKNQGFDVYLPRYRKRRRHARRVELILAPLFPSYVFVSMDVEQCQWRSINGTIGVRCVLSDGEYPMPVPEHVIAGIRERENDEGIVTLSPVSIGRGQTVRIINGPFADLHGLFEDVVDETRVMLLLSILGRQVRVHLPVEALALDR